MLERYGSCIHKKLYQLALAAGVCSEQEDISTGAKKFIQSIWELNEAMSIPKKLPEVQKADIPALAKHAEKEANPLYPVPVLMTREELEAFYYDIADWNS